MSSWIDRDAAKLKPPERRRLTWEEMLTDHLDARKVAAAPKRSAPARHPDDYPRATDTTIEAELRRFTTTPAMVHSPLREELLALGLIRVVHDDQPPFSCRGLAITPAGARRKR